MATIRALKFHGGVKVADLKEENLDALAQGMANLERHIVNIRDHYGVPVVVSINRFESDTPAELERLMEHVRSLGVTIVLANHFAEGGAGAEELAQLVSELCEQDQRPAHTEHSAFVYPTTASLWDKIGRVATTIYGASEITGSSKIRNRLKELGDEGYGHLPVCIAKTQYSFSTDPQLLGAPSDHVMEIREVRLAVGAGFVVAVCGDIMTMPGLPKTPASENIDVVNGQITGLF